jgi:predicted permease
MILYYYNCIDSGIFAIFITGSVGSVFLAYLGYKVQGDRPPQGSKQERERMRIVYVLGGGLVGAAIAFFGPPMLSIMSLHSGGPNILRLIEDHYLLEFIVIFFGSIILGSSIGYFIGKRNCFKQPKWGKWLEEHIPTPE